jgi:hypothetical protein
MLSAAVAGRMTRGVVKGFVTYGRNTPNARTPYGQSGVKKHVSGHRVSLGRAFISSLGPWVDGTLIGLGQRASAREIAHTFRCLCKCKSMKKVRVMDLHSLVNMDDEGVDALIELQTAWPLIFSVNLGEAKRFTVDGLSRYAKAIQDGTVGTMYAFIESAHWGGHHTRMLKRALKANRLREEEAAALGGPTPQRWRGDVLRSLTDRSTDTTNNLDLALAKPFWMSPRGHKAWRAY